MQNVIKGFDVYLLCCVLNVLCYRRHLRAFPLSRGFLLLCLVSEGYDFDVRFNLQVIDLYFDLFHSSPFSNF